MTRTADQIALLRTETAPALLKELQGLQAGSEELRTGLAMAISQGLSETREEVCRVLDRDQRELAQARREIDDLRRELSEAQSAWQAELAQLKSASVAPLAVADLVAETENSAQAEWADIVSSADTRTTELAEETTMSDQTPDIAEQAAADMLTELTAVIGHQTPATQPVATAAVPAPTQEQARASLEMALFDTLKTAARVGTAELVCHPHTWQFIASCTAAAEHFQLPSADGASKDDMVTVRLSGRSLMAVVNALFTTYWESSTGPGRNLQDSAMALAYYIDLSGEIRRTVPAVSGVQVDDRPVTRIVIDNRPSSAA
ncbi:hypothetical protein ACFC1R_38115 [Kitasatospora sp. NPDC056138]|uniref:hypothetical protein n=1 Tax=Kitasatospora sp. NPDC056138 TaxID=3345724 RepID=UPI0035D7E87D